MRIVIDEMPENPDPIEAGTQATVVGYDGANDLVVSWDTGRTLKLIDGVDKYHVVGSTEELNISFQNLRTIQDKLEAGENSRCQRCGESFDCCRGAVS